MTIQLKVNVRPPKKGDVFNLNGTQFEVKRVQETEDNECVIICQEVKK